ncbi:class I adenylate-forming enzyme family protein [Leifsonia shinshuensis]
MTSIAEVIAELAKSTDQRGVWSDGSWRSWSACDAAVDHLSAALRRTGIGPGDIVAIQLPNSWAALVISSAASRAGASLLPLHLSLGALETAAILRQVRPALYFTVSTHRDKDRTPVLAAAASASPATMIVAAEDAADILDRPIPLRERTADRSLGAGPGTILLVSSGTTAQRPRICVHSESALLQNAQATAQASGYGSTDVFLAAGQLSHAFGLLSFHLAIAARASIALVPEWDPARFRAAAAGSGATVLLAVPAQLHDLLNRDLWPEGAQVRDVRTGGTAVHADLATRLRRIARVRVIVQWGMSEIGVGLFTDGSPEDGVEMLHCGEAVRGSRVRVVGPSGETLPPDVAGELQFSGPSLSAGYLGEDGSLSPCDVTPDGWLRTGDLAKRTPGGAYRVIGRLDDRINRGGLKFSAGEVEALLSDLPGLSNPAILARSDPRLGERAVLFGTAEHDVLPAPSLADVVDHLTAKGISRHKLPEELILLETMPLSASGKVAKGMLRSTHLAP